LTLLLAGLLLAACAKDAAPPEQAPQVEPVVQEKPAVEETPRPWAILYAFAQEGEEIIGSSSISTDMNWAGRRIAVGWLEQPVVIASTGIGMTNAAATAQHIIDTYKPKGIIFTGVCGAIDPKLHVGDIVIPDRWVTHDYGFWGNNGLETDSVAVGRPGMSGYDRMVQIPVDSSLVRRLGEAADGIAFRFKKVAGLLPDVYKGGVGVSGNAFIGSQKKRQSLDNDLKAMIVDMESAAVVQTAHAAGIPVAVVRASSDLAGGGSGNAEEQFRANFEAAAFNAAMVVKQFLETRKANP
jgi:adenosylhomocysteine nucleosidase